MIKMEKIGPYRVLRPLGKGGMGTVYLAVHERIERQVAIKVLHGDLSANPQVARRFLNEARVVNIVRHPSLVQISDFGQTDDGITYIVMEYLEGETLNAHRAGQGGRLPLPEVLWLGRQMALGLKAAHDKGIVHRDLKPDNVMLVRDAETGALRVKLLDFGIAKVIDQGQGQGQGAGGGDEEAEMRTRAGAILGTPTYMAPEQILGSGEVDDRADVYALGCILYTLIVGRPPFQSGDLRELMKKHLREPAPLLHAADPQVPAELSTLVATMLGKVSRERPTMEQVARELSRIYRALTGVRPQGDGAARWGLRIGLGLGLAAVVLASTGWRLRGRGRGRGEQTCSAAGWCKMTLPASSSSRLRKLWAGPATAAGAGEAWAVGDGGAIMRLVGDAWTPWQSGVSVKLHGVYGFAADDVWALGDHGTLLHFDGQSFQATVGLTTNYLVAAYGVTPRDVWVVGKEGTILHFDGASWTPAPSNTHKGLSSLWAAAANDVWACGKDGLMLHFDGSGWAEVPSGTDRNLSMLFGRGRDEVWAVGKEGTILRFDGKSWARVPGGTGIHLNAITGRPRIAGQPATLWAAGDQGTILRYNGQAWVPEESGVIADLDDIFAVPGGPVLAAGAAGLVLRHEGG